MKGDLQVEKGFTNNIRDIMCNSDRRTTNSIFVEFIRRKAKANLNGTLTRGEILDEDNNLLLEKCDKYDLDVEIIEELVNMEKQMLIKTKRRNINTKIQQVIEDFIKRELELGDKKNDF